MEMPEMRTELQQSGTALMEHAHLSEGAEHHPLRGGEAAEVFAEKLGEYDVSRGAIRLPCSKPLPKELIAKIASRCFRQFAK